MAQTAYVPVAVPTRSPISHPGRTQAILGIISAVIAVLFVPPVFGIAGIVLGVIARNKGDKTLGLVAIMLSAVLMVIGMILRVVVNVVLGEGGSFIIGPLFSAF